jgi:hypothetical protein
MFYATASLRNHLWGVRIGRFYVTLAGPRRMALFSERNGGLHVLPLGGGWRLRLRINPPA